MGQRPSKKVRADKAARQEQLREQLAKQGHLQHIVEIHKKLLDQDVELDALMIQRLRAVMDSKHRLIDKYLPTEKPTELTGEVDGSLTIRVIHE
jgi:hypothetical protein